MLDALKSVGRVVVLTLQVLARASDGLGSSGAVGPGAAPIPPTKPPEEYRP
ncbi:hypothetical protein [Curtobacterium pusillum]|uniref:hypothetical protein n=1 Tax=Curtobacterium pusillum TaxID=69373 RepID=UPI001643BA7B|nr:hypothetical protein [Curtobacterium pusillum]